MSSSGRRGRHRARCAAGTGRAGLVARQARLSAPIVGATKKKHLKDALAAEALEIFEDEIAGLEKPYVPHPVLGHF